MENYKMYDLVQKIKNDLIVSPKKINKRSQTCYVKIMGYYLDESEFQLRWFIEKNRGMFKELFADLGKEEILYRKYYKSFVNDNKDLIFNLFSEHENKYKTQPDGVYFVCANKPLTKDHAESISQRFNSIIVIFEKDININVKNWFKIKTELWKYLVPANKVKKNKGRRPHIEIRKLFAEIFKDKNQNKPIITCKKYLLLTLKKQVNPDFKIDDYTKFKIDLEFWENYFELDRTKRIFIEKLEGVSLNKFDNMISDLETNSRYWRLGGADNTKYLLRKLTQNFRAYYRNEKNNGITDAKILKSLSKELHENENKNINFKPHKILQYNNL